MGCHGASKGAWKGISGAFIPGDALRGTHVLWSNYAGKGATGLAHDMGMAQARGQPLGCHQCCVSEGPLFSTSFPSTGDPGGWCVGVARWHETARCHVTSCVVFYLASALTWATRVVNPRNPHCLLPLYASARVT